MSGPAGDVPQLATSYEFDGFFDKDAQGWCASNVAITQDGARVHVREWYDENGVVRWSRERDGAVGPAVEGRVELRFDDGTSATFDLASRRLVR